MALSLGSVFVFFWTIFQPTQTDSDATQFIGFCNTLDLFRSSETSVFSSLPSLRAPCRRSFCGTKILDRSRVISIFGGEERGLKFWLVMFFSGHFSITRKRHEIHFGGWYCWTTRILSIAHSFLFNSIITQTVNFIHMNVWYTKEVFWGTEIIYWFFGYIAFSVRVVFTSNSTT